jgi:hypothetical protein
VPEGDLLIHAGDFMNAGQSLEEIVDFNNRLGEQPHPYKIVVAGNHDLLLDKVPKKARHLLSNAIYLENDGTVVGGVPPRIKGAQVEEFIAVSISSVTPS